VTAADRKPVAAMRWRHETVDVLGVRVSVADMPLLLGLMSEAVASRRQLTITFANPNYVMAAQKDEQLRELMNAFDVNLADGWGVVLAARVFGKPLPTRMANDDITDGIFGLPAEKGWRVYLFGSAPGVADQAARNLAEWYPGLNVVGTEHGYWDVERGHPGTFDPEDVERLVKHINAAKPDILHVGVPTPLQQIFVTENRDRLDVPVIITGGSYLDHLAERRHWFPPWVIKLRLGWLYRLTRDPRRLWYRYTVELADYLFRVARYRLTRGKQT
jgi:N-acetylglucosaminyldiphosphoundecaprenol N-acetyl-beta-D-mannosaminyltransferase